MDLINKKFAVDFGAKAVLHITSGHSMTFHISEMDGKPVDETETVEMQLIPLRQKLFMLTWKEKNGNMVTQIQDHRNHIVYMNWALPDGRFEHAKGSIVPVDGKRRKPLGVIKKRTSLRGTKQSVS